MTSLDAGETVRVHLHQHQGRVDHDHQGRRPRRRPELQLHDGTGTGLTADFNLDDDADAGPAATDPSPPPVTNLGTKTVTETLPVTGWTLTNLVCTGDDNASRRDQRPTGVVTLDVEAGETDRVHLHQHQGRSVTIIKDAVPDGAQNFSLHDTGTGLTADFNLDDDADRTCRTNTKTFTDHVPSRHQHGHRAPPVTGWT